MPTACTWETFTNTKPKTKFKKPLLGIKQLYNVADARTLSIRSCLTQSLTSPSSFVLSLSLKSILLPYLGSYISCVSWNLIFVVFSKQFWFRNQKVNILSKPFFFLPNTFWQFYYLFLIQYKSMSLITAAVKCTAVWWIMPDETGFQGSIQKVNITLLIQEVRESDVHAINITLLCEELANSC